MSDEQLARGGDVLISPGERAQLVAKKLGEAARRARFSTKNRPQIGGGNLRARRNARIFKIVAIASFFAIVAIPSVIVIAYYAFIASPQYTAEARFTVRGGMPPKLDGIGSLTGAPLGLIIQDTQIIINYMQSRTIVEQLDKSIGLRQLYADKNIDFLSRLSDKAKIEKATKYWKSMIDFSIQMPAGIVVFTVKAFSPDAAVRIADAALESSEMLVNQMNDQIINDTIALSQKERERAEVNLAASRANLEKTRNDEGMLSADKSAEALNSLITEVQGQLSTLRQQYDSQRKFVTENSPVIRNLEARIQAANEEIAKLKTHLTSVAGAPQTPNLAGSMSRLDYAILENQIAEKIYATSLALFEQARLASETKLMYINTFIKPVEAQEARYPHRLLNSIVFVIGALAAWGAVAGLTRYIIRKL